MWLPFLQGAAAILVLGLITFLIINKKPTVKENTIVAAKKNLPTEKADAFLPENITKNKNEQLQENVVAAKPYSKIDEEQIFYFKQRGMTEEQAVQMVMNGFCRQVFQKLPMEFAVEDQILLEISLVGSVV